MTAGAGDRRSIRERNDAEALAARAVALFNDGYN
jgi:hypothetical protein